MRRPRPTVVTLILTFGIASTAFAQEGASPFSLRAPVLGRGLVPQQSFYQYRQAVPQTSKPAPTSPAAPALASPPQDVRVPALIPYENGVARTPSTVCSARIVPMDKGATPGALVRPPKGLQNETKFSMRGAEGTCAPQPPAAVIPK